LQHSKVGKITGVQKQNPRRYDYDNLSYFEY